LSSSQLGFTSAIRLAKISLWFLQRSPQRKLR